MKLVVNTQQSLENILFVSVKLLKFTMSETKEWIGQQNQSIIYNYTN